MQGNMLQLVSSERVALDVVKRLNLTANPRVQNDFRNSDSFGRESIDEWMAESLLKNVDPKFNIGTNVLSIKYKTGDPNQAALIANAFLASTIDATIAMKAASGDQTARWFAPQLDDMRKELEDRARRPGELSEGDEPCGPDGEPPTPSQARLWRSRRSCRAARPA